MPELDETWACREDMSMVELKGDGKVVCSAHVMVARRVSELVEQ